MDQLSGGRFRSSSPQKPTREPAPLAAASAPVTPPAASAPVSPQSYRAEHTPFQPEKRPRKKRLIVIIALIIVLLIAGALFAVKRASDGATGIDSGKYQAVFFTNGQVYFGKLHAFNDGYLKMTDIFYLQAQATDTKTDTKNPQATSSDQSNVQLIKLGQEVHGPEDEMIISRDQVLFYENLKSDGKVSQTIAQYKKQ